MFAKFLSLVKFSFSNHKFITRRDPYRSLQVTLQTQVSRNQIQKELKSHEITQRQNNTNAIWIFLNQINLQHVGFLVNQMGYSIHHGKNKSMALYKWLSHKSNLVPPYSNFYISCSSVVIEDDKILMVEEKNGPRKGLFGIPGGRADAGQFLQKTAERQLLQQTGVIASFQHLIYLREMKNTVFGANDVYFVCMMKAQEKSLKEIKLCERQLASFEWVHLSKLDEFVSKKTMGTQKTVGNYINQLYRKGYKFDTHNPQSYPTISNKQVFISPNDGVHRGYMQHKLINLYKKCQKIL